MPVSRPRLPSPRAFLIAAVVLAIPGVPYAHARSQRLEVEHRAAAVAGALTNRTISVRCPGALRKRLMHEIYEGTVRFDADGVPADETRLSARTCEGLRIVIDHAPELDFTCLATACAQREAKAAESLAILTHEVMHLRGTADEALTECRARLRVAGVAQRLGVSATGAQAIATWQAGPWQARLPDRYRGATCAR